MGWNPNSNKHKAKHGGYKGKPSKSQVKATINFFDTSGLFKDMDFGKVNLILSTPCEGKPGGQLKMDL